MTGILIVNGFLRTGKFRELEEIFLEAAHRLSLSLSVRTNAQVFTGLTKRPDFVLFWDKDTLLARSLEMEGIPVYNSARCIALCDDKRKMHLALRQHGIPVPETILAPMTYPGIGFTDFSFLDAVEKRLPYPLIVKEGYGSFGAQVYLAEDRRALETLLTEKKADGFLFQRFVESSKGRDIRLQVVGDRVVGAMYRYSLTDFRANLTAGGEMEPYEPTEEEIALAIRASTAVEADFSGVDLLFGEDGPLVCEVNSNAHFKNLLQCTGVNAAYEILKYIKEKESYGRSMDSMACL